MDNSENHDQFSGFEKHTDERAALATRIGINDDTDRHLLTDALEQLRERNQRYVNTSLSDADRENGSVYWADRRVSVFKETILDIVLTAASDKGRDLESAPLLLPEVAHQAASMSGMYLFPFVETPFKPGDQTGVYEPDFATLFEQAVSGRKDGAIFIDIAFSEAYATIQQLVSSVTPDRSDPAHVPTVTDSPELDI
jgi:hypothetical protein